jgi:signal transduction histidine kinase
MIQAIRRLFKEKYLNIQAKLVLPLAITVLLLVAVISPATHNLIDSRIEEEADRRLSEVADSVGGLIENSEVLARNNASLLAKQPDVVNAFINLNASAAALNETKSSLGLQELSLYTGDFQPGDQAYFESEPLATAALPGSEDALSIREELILTAIKNKVAVSSVAITPQNSQIIGVAPVFLQGSREVLGAVVASFYMDQAYIDNISRIINSDVAVVKDDSVIITTIDPGTDYEALLDQGWLNSAETPAVNVKYSNKEDYRLLGHALVISGEQLGSVLVAQPTENLFAVSRNIQAILFSLTGVFGLTALWFWVTAFLTFTHPLAQLTQATTNIIEGDLNQKVNTSYTVFKDELTVLSENFNTMVGNLSDSYTSLEERVKQRTQELADARDDAVAANKSKTEFVSIVSHELKLPMTPIKGYSDLMLSGVTGPLTENQISFLTTIRNNVNRMAKLVSDLGDISRIESGHLRLEPREVPVWDVIDEVVSMTRTQVIQKNQTVIVDIPAELPKAWCDRNRLAQILTNLVSNANKYTPEGGAIFIRAIRENGMIQVSVEDNGLGMAPEDQLKLFTQFFRSADEKVRESPGTGLGLSITKNLIELQGGKIWFESEYRKGTSFYFTLPISLHSSPEHG